MLTIEPSSQKNKGSILGDKTRMELLAINPRAIVSHLPQEKPIVVCIALQEKQFCFVKQQALT